MKSVLAVVLLSLSSMAWAQSEAKLVAPSDAQKSFTLLKTLAGTWKGSVTTTPKMEGMGGGDMWASLRVTSRGNAIVHEMKEPGTPDDVNHDDPITMFYLDGSRLLLTHYCDAGNRPRMAARASADGKRVEFDFVDVAGNMEHGHMNHAVFTIVDANHHVEDWTYMMPGDKPVEAHMDLQRVK